MLVNVILATWVLIHNTCIVNAATHKVRRDSDDCVWDQGDIIIIPINTVDADSGDKYLFVEADLDDNLFDAEGASGLCTDSSTNSDVCEWDSQDPQNTIVIKNVKCEDIEEFELQLYDEDILSDDKIGEFDFEDEIRALVPSDNFTEFKEDLGFTDGDLNFKVRIDSTSECKWTKGDIFFVPIKANGLDDEDFFTGTTEPYVLVKVDDDKQSSETCDFIDGEDDNDCIFANSTANVLTFPDITCIAIEDFIVQMWDDDTVRDDFLSEFEWTASLKNITADSTYYEFTESFGLTDGDLTFKVRIVPKT
eukprot:CFRG4548T1